MALGEIVAREHLLDRHVAAELDGIEERHLAEPVAVGADLGLSSVEDAVSLVEVSRGVGGNLLGREYGASGRPPRGVANPGGEVANDEHGLVAEVLKLAELIQADHVTEGQVGPGRVDPQFDAQDLSSLKALEQGVLANDTLGAGLDAGKLVGRGHRAGECPRLGRGEKAKITRGGRTYAGAAKRAAQARPGRRRRRGAGRAPRRL